MYALTAFLFFIQPAFPAPVADHHLPFSPRQYICCRTEIPLNIDGRLDEKAWRKAAWTSDFLDIEGPDMPEPRFRTRAKMLWNDEHFYFAAELEEPHVWATLKKRDSVIYHDNDFEIFIDPDGDTHNYYELEMNALNTVWDLFLDKPYRDGCHPLFFWDIRGLKTGVFVDGTLNNATDIDRGWTIEVAIPWAVLAECAPGNRKPLPGEQWRVNFSRVEWQVEKEDRKYVKKINPKTGKPIPENNWVWSPQGEIALHMPERWGFVQFSAKAAGAGDDGTDEFVFKPEEKAKWALRLVYYAQKSFLDKHGEYTDSISMLGLENHKVPGYVWPPVIRHTSSQFEAKLSKETGNEMWRITHNGRVWGEKHKPSSTDQ